MDIRQAVNEHRAAAGAASGLLILIALVFGFRSGCSGPNAARASSGAGEFFSVDDGKSWFLDDSSKIPPFQHDGKTAYRVTVFRCKVDGREFVSHLERYAEADRKRIEELTSQGQSALDGVAGIELMELLQKVEVKNPGAKTWTPLTEQTRLRHTKIKHPRCPAGAGHDVEPVLPR